MSSLNVAVERYDVMIVFSAAEPKVYHTNKGFEEADFVKSVPIAPLEDFQNIAVIYIFLSLSLAPICISANTSSN